MTTALGHAALWALTVALHGSVLCLAAWLVDRLRRRADDAVAETLWRIALLGGLCTATAQLALDIAPLTAAWEADFVVEPNDAAPALPGLAPAGEQGAAQDPLALAGLDFAGLGLAQLLVLGWAAVAGVALTHLALACFALRRRLLPRSLAPAQEDFARDLARVLGLPAVPRITTSPNAPTPLALGGWRAEVCLPVRALAELSPDELRATLAHELAHVRRRDPAWSLAYAIVCRALFWHPALWWARRRLLEIAETRCDAAARAYAPALALARALLHAAEWMSRGGRGFALAHGHAMAAHAGGLRRRVRLLLDDPVPSARSSVWVRAAAMLACSGAPFVLPGVAEETVAAEAAVLPLLLPAPVATLAAEVALLQTELAVLAEEAERAGLGGEDSFAVLLHEIRRRVDALAVRCARLVDRFRHDPDLALLELR